MPRDTAERRAADAPLNASTAAILGVEAGAHGPGDAAERVELDAALGAVEPPGGEDAAVGDRRPADDAAAGRDALRVPASSANARGRPAEQPLVERPSSRTGPSGAASPGRLGLRPRGRPRPGGPTRRRSRRPSRARGRRRSGARARPRRRRGRRGPGSIAPYSSSRPRTPTSASTPACAARPTTWIGAWPFAATGTPRARSRSASSWRVSGPSSARTSAATAVLRSALRGRQAELRQAALRRARGAAGRRPRARAGGRRRRAGAACRASPTCARARGRR